MGFIAQEIQKVMPMLVIEGSDKDKTLSVNYISLIPLLTKAIQEQQIQIEEKGKQTDELKKQLDRQQKEIDELRELIKGIKK
jgi:peptidoglycan hydrolase CwlO-like protein